MVYPAYTTAHAHVITTLAHTYVYVTIVTLRLHVHSNLQTAARMEPVEDAVSLFKLHVA